MPEKSQVYAQKDDVLNFAKLLISALLVLHVVYGHCREALSQDSQEKMDVNRNINYEVRDACT